MYPTTTLPASSYRRAVVSGLVAMLAVGVPAFAQDADDGFLTTLSAERDAVQERVDRAQRAMDAGCIGVGPESCLIDTVAEQLPVIATELAGYADTVETLDIPADFADDAETLTVGLRAEVERIGATADAARAADQATVDSLFVDRINAQVDVADALDPEFARAGFVTSFAGRLDILESAGQLTADERAYLASARTVDNAAASNFACFSRSITVTYPSVDDLLAALVECGAGDALPAVEAAAAELEPPARFIEEHDWWLSVLAERSRLDRRIGEAAAAGDLIGFLANNARLGLAYRPPAELDAAFVAGYPGPGVSIDPREPLHSSAYGEGLLRALAEYEGLNPILAALSVLDFPNVPREQALPAVAELAPELRALNDELAAAVNALEPPPELAADHARIVEFFETYAAGLDDLIAAAENGDVDASFAIQNGTAQVYCEAASSLSEAILPVADVFFDPRAPICS